jgi:hypothetical protein
MKDADRAPTPHKPAFISPLRRDFQFARRAEQPWYTDEMTALHKPLTPWRVYAESFILRVIGELTGESERTLHEVDEATLRRGKGWYETFETEFSVTHALIAGIRAEWDRQHSADPALTPAEFARAIAADTFIGVADLDR